MTASIRLLVPDPSIVPYRRLVILKTNYHNIYFFSGIVNLLCCKSFMKVLTFFT